MAVLTVTRLPEPDDLYPQGLDSPSGLHTFADELEADADELIRRGQHLHTLSRIARKRARQMVSERRGVAS